MGRNKNKGGIHIGAVPGEGTGQAVNPFVAKAPPQEEAKDPQEKTAKPPVGAPASKLAKSVPRTSSGGGRVSYAEVGVHAYWVGHTIPWPTPEHGSFDRSDQARIEDVFVSDGQLVVAFRSTDPRYRGQVGEIHVGMGRAMVVFESAIPATVPVNCVVENNQLVNVSFAQAKEDAAKAVDPFAAGAKMALDTLALAEPLMRRGGILTKTDEDTLIAAMNNPSIDKVVRGRITRVLDRSEAVANAAAAARARR